MSYPDAFADALRLEGIELTHWQTADLWKRLIAIDSEVFVTAEHFHATIERVEDEATTEAEAKAAEHLDEIRRVALAAVEQAFDL